MTTAKAHRHAKPAKMPSALKPACPECEKFGPFPGCTGAPMNEGHKVHCRCSRCKAKRSGPVDEMVKGIWLLPSTLYGQLTARAEKYGVSQASIVRQALGELFARGG